MITQSFCRYAASSLAIAWLAMAASARPPGLTGGSSSRIGTPEAVAANPAPASKAARPASPVRTVSARMVRELVKDLASPKYKVRKKAQSRLLEIVDVPGVADILKAHLKSTADAEVSASLRRLLVGCDLPVAMIWYRGGLPSLRRWGGAPWLCILGDGRFVIDTASPLFTGKSTNEPAGSFREGQLTPAEIFQVQQMIDSSHQLQLPREPERKRLGKGMRLCMHLRRRAVFRQWTDAYPLKAFVPGSKPVSPPARLGLALALRDFLAARRSTPYRGPLGLQVYWSVRIRGRSYSPAEIRRLPRWKLPGVDITDKKTRSTGLLLRDADVKRVRAYLSDNDVYQYGHYAGLVYLAPYIKEAIDAVAHSYANRYTPMPDIRR